MKPLLLLLLLSSVAVLRAADSIDFGSRWELFVDEFLVAQKSGVALKLHEPDQARDRAHHRPALGRPDLRLLHRHPGRRKSAALLSRLVGRLRSQRRPGHLHGREHDGIHFTRPKLGLIEAGGTKDNNVIWRGVESHNFSPFLDANPSAEARRTLQGPRRREAARQELAPRRNPRRALRLRLAQTAFIGKR